MKATLPEVAWEFDPQVDSGFEFDRNEELIVVDTHARQIGYKVPGSFGKAAPFLELQIEPGTLVVTVLESPSLKDVPQRARRLLLHPIRMKEDGGRSAVVLCVPRVMTRSEGKGFGMPSEWEEAIGSDLARGLVSVVVEGRRIGEEVALGKSWSHVDTAHVFEARLECHHGLEYGGPLFPKPESLSQIEQAIDGKPSNPTSKPEQDAAKAAREAKEKERRELAGRWEEWKAQFAKAEIIVELDGHEFLVFRPEH